MGKIESLPYKSGILQKQQQNHSRSNKLKGDGRQAKNQQAEVLGSFLCKQINDR